MTDPQPREEQSRSQAINSASPGALRAATRLTLQTRRAQQLVQGRPPKDGKPGIIGLARYASTTKQIYLCAQADDPYADWWLIRIEEARIKARDRLIGYRAEVEQVLESVQGVKIEIAVSTHPATIELNFANPTAYQGAHLVAQFDDLCCAVLTARHQGLLDRDAAERMILTGGGAVRALFSSVLGYKYQGITRQDVQSGNPKAQAAAELMGTLPQAIALGEKRSPYAPQLSRRRGWIHSAGAAPVGGHWGVSPRAAASALIHDESPTAPATRHEELGPVDSPPTDATAD